MEGTEKQNATLVNLRYKACSCPALLNARGFTIP
jgi:hypothetical protein